MTMTKADLIEAIYKKEGCSKGESQELVELVFELIIATLGSGENVKLSRFGNFVLKDKKSRMGRNPQTGEDMEISARRVMTFRPSAVLNDKVNGNNW